MMKRKISTMILCILAIFALTGCQLALDHADGTVNEDRLVGIFLTTQYLDLFDFRAYWNDNPKSIQGGNITVDGDTAKYQGRLYAQLITKSVKSEETGETFETKEYVFPVSGIAYFSATVPAQGDQGSYFTSMSDPAISDGHVDYKTEDKGNSITLTGTVYVSPQTISHTYYFNPVYQSADGSVYAVSGSGFTVNSEAYSEGAVYSQTLEATTSETVNGKAKTDSTSVKLSISIMFTPEIITVIQMDDKNAALSQMAYVPDAMPESIPTKPDTAYLIVETHKQGETGEIEISREIYSRDADGIETFYVRDDGICIKKWVAVGWSE
jgi:hypothetical protein